MTNVHYNLNLYLIVAELPKFVLKLTRQAIRDSTRQAIRDSTRLFQSSIAVKVRKIELLIS